jgi:hypothetical protein
MFLPQQTKMKKKIATILSWFYARRVNLATTLVEARWLLSVERDSMDKNVACVDKHVILFVFLSSRTMCIASTVTKRMWWQSAIQIPYLTTCSEMMI